MLLGDSYGRMGPRFRQKSGDAYARVVREYPLSPFVEEAKKRLTEMEMAIPEADPVAYNRMKYELENRDKASMFGQAFGVLKRGPDIRAAAKSGEPAMTSLRPSIPVSVPVPAEAGGTGFTGDVTATTVQDSTTLDTKPDARGPRPAGQTPEGQQPAATSGSGEASSTPQSSAQEPSGAQTEAQSGSATPDQSNGKKKDNKKNKDKKKK